MKSTAKVEDIILSAAASACYVFALAACGVATYALVSLYLAAFVDLGNGFYLTAPQF